MRQIAKTVTASVSALALALSLAAFALQRLHFVADVLGHLTKLLHLLANPHASRLVTLDKEFFEVLLEAVNEGFELIEPFHSEYSGRLCVTGSASPPTDVDANLLRKSGFQAKTSRIYKKLNRCPQSTRSP